MATAIGLMVAATWAASSRVGTRTSERGWLGRRLWVDVATATTMGMAKAAVLPLPVRARPRTSRPASELLRVAAWMGNGVGQPARSRAAMMGAGTPSSAKVVPSTGTSATSKAGVGAAAGSVNGRRPAGREGCDGRRPRRRAPVGAGDMGWFLFGWGGR